MRSDFQEMLRRYADAAVKGSLNVQPGQRLMIIGPRLVGGVSLEAAPLVRAAVRSAYEAGAPLVEVLWGDEEVLLNRFQAAPDGSMEQVSAWQPKAMLEHAEAGGAFLSITANDPDLLNGQSADAVAALQKASSRMYQPFLELLGRNHTNWLIVAAAGVRWAAKVFPGDPAAVDRLWDAIFTMCRLQGPNAGGWDAHLQSLTRRSGDLNARRYKALHYTGPGTDLTIGLPEHHVWVCGESVTATGARFAPNMPTEEVFTMPHRDRVHGVVSSSKPLSYAGNMIEDFTLRFAAGQVVEVTAAKGADTLRNLVATDEGAARLGEVALVPHSSPISQTGLLFYNTLFDENAASHLAIGSAYRFTMKGGEAMTPDDWVAAGGNRSMVHVDFMIGNGQLDIDGIKSDDTREPLMRQGEWVTK